MENLHRKYKSKEEIQAILEKRFDVDHRRNPDLSRHQKGNGAFSAAAHGLRHDSGEHSVFRCVGRADSGAV